MTSTISAQISHIIFEQNGFVILRVKAKGNIISDLAGETYSWEDSARESEICVKGTMLHPALGVDYTFTGDFQIQKGYGIQLSFTDYSRQRPISEKAIIDYLSFNCKGIGVTTAKKIYNIFGSESIEILKTEPLRVANMLGMSVEKAIEASKRLEDIEDHEALKLQLSSLLSGTLAHKGHINAIIKKYKSAAPDIVLNQPYTLTEVSGIGFKIADSIAVKNGIDLESPERVSACTEYVIKNWERSGGHTCILKEIMIKNVCTETGLDKDLVSQHHTKHIELGLFISVSDYVYRRTMYFFEKEIAKMIANLSSTIVKEVEPRIEDLESDQAEAVILASKHPVLLLTGSAGTGKTFTIKKICETFTGFSLALCGQTGKSARRITESTGRAATTIHSLLVPRSVQGDGDETSFSFMHGKNCKLEYDVIIVDEASLLDIELAYALISSIRNGSRFIIVGDPGQLPSVGPGKFFVDIIKSQCIPHVELNKIKRQGEGSAIIKACHEIKNHTVPDIINTEGTDLYLWPSTNDDYTIESTINLFTKKITSKFGFKIEDIQVVTPNKNPDLPISTFKINNEIQKLINNNYVIECTEKNIDKKSKITFKIGDRVINSKNDQAYEYVKHEIELVNEVPIVNGDIGYIIGVMWKGGFYDQQALEELSDGSRNEVLSGRSKDINIIVEFPHITVGIPAKKNHLDLSYAITCHKAQGSEYKVVIIPIPRGINNLINRSWLYTALSRGKELVIIVSQRNAFEYGCLTPDKSRDSYLSYFIQGEMRKIGETVDLKESASELGWEEVNDENLF